MIRTMGGRMDRYASSPAERLGMIRTVVEAAADDQFVLDIKKATEAVIAKLNVSEAGITVVLVHEQKHITTTRRGCNRKGSR